MKTSLHLRKLCLAAVLTAVCVATSTFSVPVGASRCFPIQHLCNILAGVFLGPWYSVAMAFSASLLRNLMGTGTLLAFPGSMAGALLGGILYQYCGRKLVLAYLGELMGTSILGGVLAWPLAVFVLGKEAAVFAYVFPFFVSCAGGTIIAVFLVGALKKTGALDRVLSPAVKKL